MTNNHKIKPRKLGHLVLAVRDIHKSVEFYTEVLGLQVSDWISDQMCFLARRDRPPRPGPEPDPERLPGHQRPAALLASGHGAFFLSG